MGDILQEKGRLICWPQSKTDLLPGTVPTYDQEATTPSQQTEDEDSYQPAWFWGWK